MTGHLTEAEMNDLLHQQLVGRIGCYVNDMVYVVPTSYACNGKDIYVHTEEGLKVEGMRRNPHVCFEVDDFADMGNWKSVIAWGKFEELKQGEDRAKGLKILMDRHLPPVSSVTTHLNQSWPFYSTGNEEIGGIVFRISISRCTGRFESTSASPAIQG